MKTKIQLLFRFFLHVSCFLLSYTYGYVSIPHAWAESVSCNDDHECRGMAKDAHDHSSAGRWIDARNIYERAYARWQDPKLLFNLARISHKAEQWTDAVQFYRRYIEAGAEGNEQFRKQAADFLAQALSEQSKRESRTGLVPAVTDPSARKSESETRPELPANRPQESPPKYRRAWFWAALGIATVGVGLSLGLGLASRRPDLSGLEVAKPYGGL